MAINTALLTAAQMAGRNAPRGPRLLQQAPGDVMRQPTMNIGGGNTGGRQYTPNYFQQQGGGPSQVGAPVGGPGYASPTPSPGVSPPSKMGQGMPGGVARPPGYTPPSLGQIAQQYAPGGQVPPMAAGGASQLAAALRNGPR